MSATNQVVFGEKGGDADVIATGYMYLNGKRYQPSNLIDESGNLLISYIITPTAGFTEDDPTVEIDLTKFPTDKSKLWFIIKAQANPYRYTRQATIEFEWTNRRTKTVINIIQDMKTKATITAITDGNGTVAPTTQEVKCGDTATITATPNTGYDFDHWENSEGTSVGTARVLTLPNVTDDATYKACFTIQSFTITASVSPSGAGSVDNPSQTVTYGGSCSITATPVSTYNFSCWKDSSGTSVGTSTTLSLSNITASASYTAEFVEKPKLTITVNAGTGGNISIDSGTQKTSDTKTGGAGVTPLTASISAHPDSTHSFTQWNDGNTDNPRSVSVTTNTEYTASFTELARITITVNAGTGGNISIDSGTQKTSDTKTGGAGVTPLTATITAHPDSTHSFTQWDDGNTDNPRSVSVTTNTEYTASFTELGRITLTVLAGEPTGTGGTIQIDTQGDKSSDTKVSTPGASSLSASIKATAADHFHFDKWQKGSGTTWTDVGTDNPLAVNISSDTTYRAKFNKDTHTITVVASPTEGGTVSGGGTFAYGTSHTITATANTNYAFEKWNDGDTNASRSIMVTGNATYTATFKSTVVTWTVSASVSGSNGKVKIGSGSASTSTSTTVTSGGSCTITAVPNSGYEVDTWGGAASGSSTSVTLSNITSNKNVTVSFKQQATTTYTVTASVSGSHGSVSPTSQTVASGGSCSVTATPDSGYEVDSWSGGGSGSGTTRTFSNVTSNQSCSVTFKSSGPTGGSWTVTISHGDGNTYFVVSGSSSTLPHSVTIHCEEIGTGNTHGWSGTSSDTLYGYECDGIRFIWIAGSTEIPGTATSGDDTLYVCNV